MADLYFSKLNGYKVKDAEAREAVESLELTKASHTDVASEVETLNASISAVAQDLEDLETIVNAGGVGGSGGASSAVDISFENTASGLTATTVQGAIDETVERVKTLEEAEDASAPTVIYDSETDYIQVIKNGEAIDVLKAYTERRDLYVSTANEGNFTTYAGNISGSTVATPTMTCGSSLTITLSQTSNNMGQGSVLSELFDLSKYETIRLTHTSSTTTANVSAFVSLFVTTAKASKMTALATINILSPNATSASGDITLDVSAITEECYIGIVVGANSSGSTVTTTTAISDFYIE